MQKSVFYAHPRRVVGQTRKTNASYFARILILTLSCWIMGRQNVNAQCGCPDISLLEMSLVSDLILPFCDEIGIQTKIANLVIEDCPADVLLRVSFGTPTESNTNATLLSFNYLGNLTLVSQDFWFDGQNTWRRFSLRISDIPPGESVENLVRFSLTPTSNFIDPAYLVLVDVIPQDTECGDDPDGNIETSAFSTEFELIESPINGLVSDLITAGRLLNNSSTNSIVERKTIHGTLEVDDDYSFDGPGGLPLARPRLYLGPGAKILVKSGNTLTLTNADIFTCDILAAGIEVESGATLIATASTFNDARFAINAKPGATLSLTSNSFFDNYIGLNLDMSSSSSGNKRVNLSAFSANSFSTAQAAINAPYSGMPEPVEARGFCGIRLYDYRDFNVFGGATFSNLANGIVAYNSTGSIGNMTFTDMNTADLTPAYPFEGFGVRLAGKGSTYWFNVNDFPTSMTFDSCKTGIYANSYALNVEKTTMTNVDVGIDIANSRKRDIILDQNTITARKFGIRSGLNEPLHFSSVIRNNTVTITGLGTGTNPVTGIQLEEIGLGYTPLPGQTAPQPAGTDGWEVTGNIVAMEKGGRGILYRNGVSGLLESNAINDQGQGNDPGEYHGIRTEGTTFSQVNFNDVTRSTSAGGNATSRAINSSAGFANAFTCNCVDNTGVGLQFFDMADFTNNVKGNKLNDHDGTGIQLSDEDIGNAYIGIQYHTGNEWVTTPSGFGAVNWGGTSDIVYLSKFWVDPNEKSGALSPDVDPEDWFEDQVTTPPSFDCDNGCSAPTVKPPFEGESDTPTFLDEAIATDKLYPDVFEDETNWKGAYRLYRKMLRHPAIESYATEFEDFKEAHDSLSTGRLAYIAEEKAEIFSLSGVQDTILENFRLAWRDEMEDLRHLDSLRHAGDTTISHGQYDTVVQFGVAALSQYALYLDTLAMGRSVKIQNLIALNAAVSTTLAPDDNHKTVNNIVLNFLLTDTLASGDLTTLEGIAEQCPLEGGDAVYEARAFVSYYTGTDYNDFDLCAPPQPRQKQVNGKSSGIKDITLYPNPTTGEVFLSVSGEVQVRVFNNIGQLQMEKTVADNRLNLSQLQPGVYRLQLFREGRMLTTQSVILLNR